MIVAPPQRRVRRRRSATLGYALLAPSLFGVVAFLLIPIVIVVWLSFQKWDLISPAKFVGLANWTAVLGDPTFGNSLGVTALFTVMVIVVELSLGMFVAVLLTRKLPGSGLFRVIFVIPWVCAPLALGVVWNWIFQPSGGALNTLLGTHIQWLTNPWLALPSVAVVTIWSQVGYVSLFFMAGLAVIPDSVVEAATVDGANAGRVFWSIKLPLLRPTLFFVLVTSVVSTFQAFDTVYSLYTGVPPASADLLAVRIYQQAFSSFNLGQAAVTALVLFIILIAVTIGQQLYFRRKITYDLG